MKKSSSDGGWVERKMREIEKMWVSKMDRVRKWETRKRDGLKLWEFAFEEKNERPFDSVRVSWLGR